MTPVRELDQRAAGRLLESMRGPLEVHCYRMLGSLDDAQDVVQEVMLRAWKGLDRFDGRSSPSTWLYRIATNACLDEIERRPRRPVPVEPFPDARLEAIVAPISDPAALYALHEGMELALLAAIQLLPGRQRAVLILRDVLGWTGPETAELLGTTPTAVRSALQRARETVAAHAPERGRLPDTAARARALLRQCVAAWRRGDVDALVELLHDDAVMRMPPRADVIGPRAIGAFFRGLPDDGFARTEVTPSSANGRPVLVMHRHDGERRQPHGVLVLWVGRDRVERIDAHLGSAVVERFRLPPRVPRHREQDLKPPT